MTTTAAGIAQNDQELQDFWDRLARQYWNDRDGTLNAISGGIALCRNMLDVPGSGPQALMVCQLAIVGYAMVYEKLHKWDREWGQKYEAK